jgi:hypothetical protein
VLLAYLRAHTEPRKSLFDVVGIGPALGWERKRLIRATAPAGRARLPRTLAVAPDAARGRRVRLASPQRASTNPPLYAGPARHITPIPTTPSHSRRTSPHTPPPQRRSLHARPHAPHRQPPIRSTLGHAPRPCPCPDREPAARSAPIELYLSLFEGRSRRGTGAPTVRFGGKKGPFRAVSDCVSVGLEAGSPCGTGISDDRLASCSSCPTVAAAESAPVRGSGEAREHAGDAARKGAQCGR